MPALLLEGSLASITRQHLHSSSLYALASTPLRIPSLPLAGRRPTWGGIRRRTATAGDETAPAVGRAVGCSSRIRRRWERRGREAVGASGDDGSRTRDAPTGSKNSNFQVLRLFPDDDNDDDDSMLAATMKQATTTTAAAAAGGAAAAAAAAVVGDGGKQTAGLVGRFLREQLARHRSEWHQSTLGEAGGLSGAAGAVPPLFVAVQGPQGCGKSHLTTMLPDTLAPHGIKTAVLSLDDLYLPHSGLVSLSSAHPDNLLLRGRGQPGTHDLPLGLRCLDALKAINEGAQQQVEMPIFDKSRFGGEGDRSEGVITVTGAVDIVVLEGWMMGFYPLEEEELRRKYADAVAAPRKEGVDPPFFLAHSLTDLVWANDVLREYGSMWSRFDCFVQMKPVEMGYTWQWRLEEHNMKAANGGIGMSDEQIKAFIARYMPGYELFLESVQNEGTPWKARGLQLVIGRGREVISIDSF